MDFALTKNYDIKLNANEDDFVFEDNIEVELYTRLLTNKHVNGLFMAEGLYGYDIGSEAWYYYYKNTDISSVRSNIINEFDVSLRGYATVSDIILNGNRVDFYLTIDNKDMELNLENITAN